MASILDVLSTVDGMREETARRIKEQFPTLAALAGAQSEELEQVKGVGQTLAGRVLVAAGRAQAAASDPNEAARMAKDATAAGMAVATEVVGAAGKVAGKLASPSDTAKGVARDAEIAAKTGVFRAHAEADKAIDKTTEAVGPAAKAAKSVADKAVGTAKGVADRAMDTARGVAGKAAAGAGAVSKAAASSVRRASDAVAADSDTDDDTVGEDDAATADESTDT